MYFAKTDRLHEMEKLMSGIPNFSPRGQGKTVLQCKIDSYMKGQPPPDDYTDVLKATMIAIHHQPFLERLESLIKESESETVMYRNMLICRVMTWPSKSVSEGSVQIPLTAVKCNL